MASSLNKEEWLNEMAKRSLRALVKLALKGDEVALEELRLRRNIILLWKEEVPEVEELFKKGLL